MPPSRSRAAEPDSSSPTTEPSLPPSPDPTPSSPLFSAPHSPDPWSPETDPEWSPSPDASDAGAESGLDTPSAPRSTGKGARARIKALRETAATAISTLGGIAHILLTREGSPERDAELWLPDDDDVESISEPLASLASRRLPEGAENPDVTDLAQLVLGVVKYVLKQREKQMAVQRYYQHQADAEGVDVDAPEPVDV